MQKLKAFVHFIKLTLQAPAYLIVNVQLSFATVKTFQLCHWYEVLSLVFRKFEDAPKRRPPASLLRPSPSEPPADGQDPVPELLEQLHVRILQEVSFRSSTC